MNDPELRALLRPLLREGVQIEELPCGNTRADLVHIHPDYMHGYELKGAGDTLKRAENQLRCYARAYDFVSFVVTANHLRALLPLLPEWVGVQLASPARLEVIRAATPSPLQNRGHLIGLLRQAEVKAFLKQRGEVGHSKKRDFELLDVLIKAEHIPLAEVGAYVRQCLTVRLPERLKAREILRAHAAAVDAAEAQLLAELAAEYHYQEALEAERQQVAAGVRTTRTAAQLLAEARRLTKQP